jgi:hypothetical protein
VSLQQKLRDEIISVGSTALFFGLWFLVLLVLKWLILAEYAIQFHNLSMALVGALIVAKVVLVLENVPLETLMRSHPALVHVIVRTVLYGLGVFVVLVLEKAFEARHEYGGFAASVVQVFHNRDTPHVLATAIAVTAALLVFNLLSVVRRHLGNRALLRLFLSPLPEGTKE